MSYACSASGERDGEMKGDREKEGLGDRDGD